MITIEYLTDLMYIEMRILLVVQFINRRSGCTSHITPDKPRLSLHIRIFVGRYPLPHLNPEANRSHLCWT